MPAHRRAHGCQCILTNYFTASVARVPRPAVTTTMWAPHQATLPLSAAVVAHTAKCGHHSRSKSLSIVDPVFLLAFHWQWWLGEARLERLTWFFWMSAVYLMIHSQKKNYHSTPTASAGTTHAVFIAAQRHFRSSPRRSKLDFEIFVCSFATHFKNYKKVVRIAYYTLPQVYLRHFKNSYVGKKSEHRSDLVPGGVRNLSGRSSADLVTSIPKRLILTWNTVFLTGFSETAMQRARGACFVNRYGTFWKEENFNFP